MRTKRHKSLLFLYILFTILFFSCASTKKAAESNLEETIAAENFESEALNEATDAENLAQNNNLKLLFGGDIMAHEENLRLKDFSKIWRDVNEYISSFDLAFANIESPVDPTKAPSTYPNFNMPVAYVQAAIDAGFDAFSLCNNHTNDQGLKGIKETILSTEKIRQDNLANGNQVFFAGLKDGKEADYTWCTIEKNGWKILFLPVTELLNRPTASDHVNFIKPDKESRKTFIEYCKKLRQENPCDLFILSLHTSEVEYRRSVTKAQEDFYMELLECGIDILWANHAHIIKDRKFVFNKETGSQKLIMFANGNTISGQRRDPALDSKNPNSERDNTGDGLLYEIEFTKSSQDSKPQIVYAKPFYITTYINTAEEFIIKPLTTDFINYLYNIPRKNWAEYITRRKKITEESTKDYIIWQ